MYVVAVPAYGRDYRSGVEVKKSWEDNEDFLINTATHKDDGRYFNKAQSGDLKEDGITHIQFRYKKLTRVIIIKL